MTRLPEFCRDGGAAVTTRDATGQELPLPIELAQAAAPSPVRRDGRGFVRDRQHRFPGRKHALKVLYDDVEVTAVRAAAEAAGLTPTGFVAAAGLTLAGTGTPPVSSTERQLLGELLQLRTALGRYTGNLNQAVTSMRCGEGAPVWLLRAVAGCARATERVDVLTVALSRRLG
jgi:hypothetical protein